MPSSSKAKPRRTVGFAGGGGGGNLPLSAVFGRGELGTSLLFVFPLFLAYEVGVLFSPTMNGVDFVSRNVFALVNYDRSSYLLAHLGLALGYVVLLAYLRRKRTFDPGRFLPMLLESTIFALTIGSFIVFVMRKVLGVDPDLSTAAASPGRIVNTILSIGAGVHEELVFRLGLLSGGAALLRVLGTRHVLAVPVAFVVSSLLFSAAHHLGASGDPWTLGVFTYRFLAGLMFGAIYYYRSLGHAVYTHALYDVFVLVIR